MKKRFYSFLVRWCSIQGNPLPAWLTRACGEDPRLRAEHLSEEVLSADLREQRIPAQVHPDAGALSAKILAALRAEGKTSSERRLETSTMVSVWKVVVCPVAAAIGVAFFLTIRVSTSSGHVPEAALVSVDRVFEAPAGDTGLMEAGWAGWVNPLDREVEYVLEDAKGAVAFLASSFLPRRVTQGVLKKGDGAS